MLSFNPPPLFTFLVLVLNLFTVRDPLLIFVCDFVIRYCPFCSLPASLPKSFFSGSVIFRPATHRPSRHFCSRTGSRLLVQSLVVPQLRRS